MSRSIERTGPKLSALAAYYHDLLTPGSGLAEEWMYSSKQRAPLLAHQSGSAARADCR